MNERDLLGMIARDDAYLAELRAAATGPDGYVPYRAALRLARRHQPWDPTNPKKEFARDLRIEIIDQLGLKPDEYGRVKCYTAIGTPIDVFHGVDGFLELEDPKTNTLRRVTIDLSLREKEGQKADVLIPELPDPQFEERAYLDAIARHGTAVAERLRVAKAEPLDSGN